MSRALRMLVRLLFHRPLVAVLLVVIYLVTALLLLTVESDKLGIAVAAMGAFAAGGLAAVLTERIARYSRAAGSLGLPDHARLMRLAQGWFLALFVMAPVVFASALGMPPLAAIAVLCAATAAGIALLAFGPFWLILVPLLRWGSLGAWLALPAVQAVGTAASAWMIWKWFQLPEKAQREGGLVPVLLADARHESGRSSEDLAEGPSQDEESAQVSDAQVIRVSQELATGRNLPSMLATLFRYSVTTHWRVVLFGMGVAIFLLVACYAYRGANLAAAGYAIATGGCCVAMVGRLQNILQRWMSTSTEQSLLRLAPRWPEARLIKRAVLQSVFLVQLGSIAVWAASSVFALLLGWIGMQSVLTGGLALVGTSLAFSGSVCAVLARRRAREWHLSTVAIVVLVIAGGLTLLFGDPHSSSHVVYGAALMLVPPAAATAWYLVAPLRLPLDVDPRALGVHL